jgi:hypothetical protein
MEGICYCSRAQPIACTAAELHGHICCNRCPMRCIQHVLPVLLLLLLLLLLLPT